MEGVRSSGSGGGGYSDGRPRVWTMELRWGCRLLHQRWTCSPTSPQEQGQESVHVAMEDTKIAGLKITDIYLPLLQHRRPSQSLAPAAKSPSAMQATCATNWQKGYITTKEHSKLQDMIKMVEFLLGRSKPSKHLA